MPEPSRREVPHDDIARARPATSGLGLTWLWSMLRGLPKQVEGKLQAEEAHPRGHSLAMHVVSVSLDGRP